MDEEIGVEKNAFSGYLLNCVFYWLNWKQIKSIQKKHSEKSQSNDSNINR